MTEEQGAQVVEYTYEAAVQLTHANERLAVLGSLQVVTLVFVVAIGALVLARVVRR